LGWQVFVDVDFVHEVHVAVEVGPTSEPHVVGAPASQAMAGGPLLVGGGVPQALLFGTQTLT
jgi:hypothetical protein